VKKVDWVNAIPPAGLAARVRAGPPHGLLRAPARRGDSGDPGDLRFFTFQTIEELFAGNGMTIEAVFKKADGGWNIRLLNALLLGALRHTLYLHYVVRVRAA
jgi:hypothetical protein